MKKNETLVENSISWANHLWEERKEEILTMVPKVSNEVLQAYEQGMKYGFGKGYSFARLHTTRLSLQN
jgi:hypothetical protein